MAKIIIEIKDGEDGEILLNHFCDSVMDENAMTPAQFVSTCAMAAVLQVCQEFEVDDDDE